MAVMACCSLSAVQVGSRADRSFLAPPPRPQLRPMQDPDVPVPEMHLNPWEAFADAGSPAMALTKSGGCSSACSTDLPPEEYEELISAQASFHLSLGADGQWRQSGADRHGLVKVQDGDVDPLGAAFKAQSLSTEDRCCPFGAWEDHARGCGADMQPCVSPWLLTAIGNVEAEVVKKRGALAAHA